MDFYKSRNSNSTSSNHSNSSHRTHVSNSSKSSSTSYNLEYCTSSSSISPFAATRSCPSSTAKSLVNVAIDEVLVPSSVVSHISCSSPSAVSSVAAAVVAVAHSSQSAPKRKYSSPRTLDDKDPELGLEPPSAKRQQRLPSLYQSDPSSVFSSVYPSPIDVNVQDIDGGSSSDCLSTTTEYDVATDNIPDSPRSLRHENGDENGVEDDDEIVSGTTSPSVCSSTISSKELDAYDDLHTHTDLQYHGEMTPAERYSHDMCESEVIQPKVKSFIDCIAAHYDCLTPAAEPESSRQCPLPALSWANADDVWKLMCKKDEQAACTRDASMLDQHPGLQPRMRAILLDWLIEVCEVYKLHRETYYLAVDYLDRYLSTQKKVQKTHLQLIGITCLFIAAKVEEIYPPKINEFAYVTDGACQEADILKHEILLLQALEWNISPVTVMGWLGVYMQLNVNNRTPASFGAASKLPKKSRSEVDDAFIYPQFSGMEFVQTAQLLDLCTLDVGMGNYPYSVIAAAAISHTFNRETAMRCSGLDWQTIESCARWMEPFFHVIREESRYLYLTEQNEQVSSKCGLGHICPNIVTDDSHIIQAHTITMTMFERVCLLQEQHNAMALKIKQEASPAIGLIRHEQLLTPPASSRKPPSDDEEEDDAGTDVPRATNLQKVAKSCVKVHEKTL